MIKAFTGAQAEQRAERAGHWIKAACGRTASQHWCAGKGIALQKATNESGNSAGGFLVMTDLENAIFAVRDTVGAFRNADVLQSRSDHKVRPRRSGGLTANFVAEGASIPESQMQFDALGFVLKKQALLGRFSNEMLEDSAADLGEYCGVEMGNALAAVEDDCGFNGDGTSTYAGIQGLATKMTGSKSAITAASGHNTFLTLDNTDIANLMAGVLATAIPGARWYTSAIGYAQTFCRLAGVSGGLVSRQLADGTIQANYLGFPISFSTKLPQLTTSLAGKPLIYFGNLKQSSVLVEHKSGTVIAFSSDRAMDTDQTLMRGVRREDIINHNVGDASTYGPVAALIGGA